MKWKTENSQTPRAFTFMALLLGALTLTGLAGCAGDSQVIGAQDADETDSLYKGTPLFYVRKVMPTDPTDLTEPLTYQGPAQLIRKERAEPGAAEQELTDRAFTTERDVRDLEVSYDGQYVLFAMRAAPAEGLDEAEQPKWNLWEYHIKSDTLTRVISDDIVAERGHDLMPRYINLDRDIVFSSTRQQRARAILQDEGKPGFTALDEDRDEATLNLHTLNRRTGAITQITFNASHDLYPAITPNGQVLYIRWDNFGQNQLNLYQINVDGTANQYLYGHNSHSSGSNDSDLHFSNLGLLPDGRLHVLAHPLRHEQPGGDIISFDPAVYADNTRLIDGTEATASAQFSLVSNNVTTDGSLSLGGAYTAITPYQDGSGKLLVSWQLCRLNLGELTVPCLDQYVNDPAATPAPPAYGVWMIDPVEDIRAPIIAAREGHYYSDLALGTKRSVPEYFVPGSTLNTALTDGRVDAGTFADLIEPTNAEGILHIRNVYDLGWNTLPDYDLWRDPALSNASDRPARFLRVIKGVPEPDNDTRRVANGSYGRFSGQRMRELIGYAPIEPDGSVKVRIPAQVPLMISVVDADGRRISERHQNWLSVQPGEVLECGGCHSRGSELPHGRQARLDGYGNPGGWQGQPFTSSNPSLTAPWSGATMAETRAWHDPATLGLRRNPVYTDVWTDPLIRTPDPELALNYEDIPLFDTWVANDTLPTNTFCDSVTQVQRHSLCRIVINYEQHIQPLWELERTQPEFAAANAHDGGTTTCIRCHSLRDEFEVARLPAGQLDLDSSSQDTGTLNPGIRMVPYMELFYDDVEKVLADSGDVVDCTREVPRLDDNGDPVLDAFDQPLFDTVLCDPTIDAPMSTSGAHASRFMTLFAADGTHAGYLSPAELRLISEWLDLGGQYYNNHFDAPLP